MKLWGLTLTLLCSFQLNATHFSQNCKEWNTITKEIKKLTSFEVFKNEAEAWDAAVLKASKIFETRLHCMVCGNDCHSHVAVALNLMGYGGFSWWNKVILAAWIFFGGRHTTWVSVATTWIGPALVALIVLVACL